MSVDIEKFWSRVDKESTLCWNWLEKTQHSVFRKRREIRHLIRQLEGWKKDNRLDVARVKEIKGLKSNLARIRFNGWAAAGQRDKLLAALLDYFENLGPPRTAEGVHLYEVARQIDIELQLPGPHMDPAFRSTQQPKQPPEVLEGNDG